MKYVSMLLGMAVGGLSLSAWSADLVIEGALNTTDKVVVHSGDVDAVPAAALHVADGDLLVEGDAVIDRPDGGYNTTLRLGGNRAGVAPLTFISNYRGDSVSTNMYGAFMVHSWMDPSRGYLRAYVEYWHPRVLGWQRRRGDRLLDVV